MSKALYDNPNDFEAAMLLGETATQTGDRSLAGEVLDYATSLKPSSDEPWLALTRLQLSGSKLIAAEKSIRHALRLNPKRAESHGLLGRIMLNRARWDQAIPSFEKALVLAPNNSYFRNDLGLVYLMKHDFAKAVEVLKPLSERKDLPAFMYNNLGLAYEGLGLIQEASEQFEMALERNPGYTKARVNLDCLARQAKLAQTPPVQKGDDTPPLQPLEETPPSAPNTP